MYIAFLVILAVMFAIVPILDAFVFGGKKAEGAPIVSDKGKSKCKGYCSTMVYYLCFILPVIIMCIIGGISFYDIGFSPIRFEQNIWFTIIVIIVAVALFIYEFVIPVVSKSYRARLLEDEGEDIDELPQTNKEKWLYSFQTLSSALCEESWYRGFLLFLLLTIFPGMPIFLIILIAFVTFAVGHVYQGVKSMVEVGLFGALSMSLLIVTGSLIPSMLLHFFTDFVAVFMIRKRA